MHKVCSRRLRPACPATRVGAWSTRLTQMGTAWDVLFLFCAICIQWPSLCVRCSAQKARNDLQPAGQLVVMNELCVIYSFHREAAPVGYQAQAWPGEGAERMARDLVSLLPETPRNVPHHAVLQCTEGCYQVAITHTCMRLLRSFSLGLVRVVFAPRG